MRKVIREKVRGKQASGLEKPLFNPQTTFRVAKLALCFDSQGILVPKRQYLNNIARGPEFLGDQMTGQD
jgi:hypothetical protein